MEEAIDNISEKIAGIICNDSRELEIITYGVHQTIVMMLNLLLTVASGIVWHELFFMTVMFLYFSILRPYAGGYHAETEGKCLVISIAMVNLVLFGKQYFRLGIPVYLLICLVSVAVIFLWAPIGNPNKTLDMTERAVYRRKSQIIAASGFNSFMVAVIFKWQILYEGIAWGLILAAALLIAGKIKYRDPFAMQGR